jgi:hypothetical protein
MNKAHHIASKNSQEFEVELYGAYEGKYRVFVIGELVLAFFHAPVLLQVVNQDIIDLIKETILIK